MRIVVFGTGGVGGYFGGRLAQAGHDVVFIARGAHLDAIKNNGLRVESIKGDFTIRPANATDNPAGVGTVDLILVAVKAWQVPQAATAMQALIGPETMVIPLGNGVDAPDQLADVLGRDHILGGLCRIFSSITRPGVVTHSGVEPFISFGELDGPPGPRVERLRQVFDAAGIWVETPDDIQVAMWEKFLLIATFSGLCAVTRSPMGVVRSLPQTRRLLRQALVEGEAVARARGVNLPSNVVDKTMSFFDNVPADMTASMQRDIMEGKPSELDAQNGAISRLGAEYGIPTPLHDFIYASLLPQENAARAD